VPVVAGALLKVGIRMAKAAPANKAAAPATAPPVAAVPVARARAVAAKSLHDGAEAKFVALVLDLGLTKSRALIERVRAALGA
jgi:hypothetical protein